MIVSCVLHLEIFETCCFFFLHFSFIFVTAGIRRRDRRIEEMDVDGGECGRGTPAMRMAKRLGKILAVRVQMLDDTTTLFQIQVINRLHLLRMSTYMFIKIL